MGDLDLQEPSCPGDAITSQEAFLSATLDSLHNIGVGSASSAITLTESSLYGVYAKVVGLDGSELTFNNDSSKRITLAVLRRVTH